MSQPKSPQPKSKMNDEDRAAIALQQYNDTVGHFSLVRWARALVFRLFPVLTDLQEFSTS